MADDDSPTKLIFTNILPLTAAFLLFVFGFGTIIQVWRILNTPILSGYVPIWAIIVAGLVLVLFLKPKKKANDVDLRSLGL